MSKIKVINKGYTLKVISWENDGDNYKTNFKTVDTLEKAEMLYKLMQLCVSKNNQPKNVIKLGNSTEFSSEQIQLIIYFFNNYPAQLKDYLEKYDISDEELSDMDEDEKTDFYVDMFYEIAGDLLGSSEYYDCRVMESCTVTYSPEDIYLEEVIFKDE